MLGGNKPAKPPLNRGSSLVGLAEDEEQITMVVDNEELFGANSEDQEMVQLESRYEHEHEEEEELELEQLPGPNQSKEQLKLPLHHPSGKSDPCCDLTDVFPCQKCACPSRKKCLRKTRKFCAPNLTIFKTMPVVKHTKEFVRSTNEQRVPKAKAMFWDFIYNIKSGIATSVINFPLVLAIGANTGAAAQLGVTTAFWSAVASTLFGGSSYTICAPTTLLTSNLVSSVALYGGDILPLIAIGASIFVFLMLFLRLHEYLTFIPSMATHGLTLGTAALILIYQIKFALALHGNIVNSSVPYYLYQTLLLLPDASGWSFLMYIIAFGIQYSIARWIPKIPAAAVMPPLGILVSWILDLTLNNSTTSPPYIETMGTRYGSIVAEIVKFPSFRAEFFTLSTFGTMAEIGFICLLEVFSTNMMVYEVTNKGFSKNHEFLALGFANLSSGIFGGMPTSCGYSKTMGNISTGATSRASGLINGLCLLLFSLTLAPLMKMLPMPVIAAMQCVSAIRAVNLNVWKHVWKTDRKAFFASMVSALLCVILNPAIGLLIGIVISMSLFSHALGKGSCEVSIKTKVTGYKNPLPGTPDPVSTQNRPRSLRNALTRVKPMLQKQSAIVYRISGVLTFINAAAHLENLKFISKSSSAVVINFRYLYYVDYDGLVMLNKLITHLDEKLRIPVFIVGVNSFLKEIIRDEAWFIAKEEKEEILKKEEHALKRIQARNNRSLIEIEVDNMPPIPHSSSAPEMLSSDSLSSSRDSSDKEFSGSLPGS